MEFLSLSRRRYSSRNVLSGEERGETAVFARFFFFLIKHSMTEYDNVIKDQIERGTVEVVNEESRPDLVYYIPHHGVIS